MRGDTVQITAAVFRQTSLTSINPSDSELFLGGGPRVVVSTAAFHASGFGSRSRRFERNKNVSPHPRVKVGIVGSLRDREVACSTSDRQGSNFESCVWRTVSSQSSHHSCGSPGPA